MRKHVAVLALVAVAVALAGCGNSESSGAPGNPASGNLGSSGGGGSDEISKLLAKTKEAKYKVTYESGNDKPITIAQDPPRFSYVSGDSASYVLADGSAVSCSGKGSSATCTALPGGDAIKTMMTTVYGAVGSFLLSDAGNGIPGLLNIKTTDKKIAGRDAACATIDSSALGVLSAVIKGSYTVCIDKQTGIMLQTKSDDGSGSTSDLTAIDFGAPTDADLTPPATTSTIPGQ
jgi:hypothetical protein